MKVKLTGINPSLVNATRTLINQLNQIKYPIEVSGYKSDERYYVYLPMLNRPKEIWSLLWFTHEEIEEVED